MTLIILIFAALTCLAGIVILINPEIVFGFLREHSKKFALQILAIAIRLILGVLLIIQSGASNYPFVIEIIGWLSITVAVVFAAIGRNNYNRLMNLALSQVTTLGRIGGIFALVFGAFLIHSYT